jgi:hypothetical protein
MKHLVLLLPLFAAGCVSAPLRNDVPRLLTHPQFNAAAKAAPDFTTEAMNTIARLDHELNSRP